MKIQRLESKYIPFGGMELWNPKYRDFTDKQLNKAIKEYEPFYEVVLFCQATATIYLFH